MTALQQALRVDVNVVTEATGASRFFQLCERRLYGLPQRRPVSPLHRELPAHATAHAERGGGDRAQYFEVCGTRARAFGSSEGRPLGRSGLDSVLLGAADP